MSHTAVMIPGLDQLGGAERQAMALARGLRCRGWRVSMVALSGSGGAAAAELRDSGVEFLSLEMHKGIADPRGWVRLHRWLKRERPDVLHAHLPHASWMARWSRIASSVPVLVDTLHTSSTGTMCRRLGYAASRWWPDRVTAVSRAAAESHLDAGIVRKKNLSVLPNGIDVDFWQPDAEARAKLRQELGLSDEFLWLAAGRLETVKGYPLLLTAMSRVPAVARLVVLGEGQQRMELQRLTDRLGLGRRVRFLGFQGTVRHWMQAADGFVLASQYEGLPMVLLEAGACGLPAVATDVAGTREVLVNGETGWLACGDGPDALAAVLSRLMRVSSMERLAMGERARQFVVDHFSLDKVLDQWEGLYTELLERRRMRGSRFRIREALTRQSATEA